MKATKLILLLAAEPASQMVKRRADTRQYIRTRHAANRMGDTATTRHQNELAILKLASYKLTT